MVLLYHRPHVRADGVVTTPDLLIDRAVVVVGDRSTPVHDLRVRCSTPRDRGDSLTPAIGVLGGQFGPIVMPTLLVGEKGPADSEVTLLALVSRDAHRLAVPLDQTTDLRLSIGVNGGPPRQSIVTAPDAERGIAIATEGRGVLSCIAVADLSVPIATTDLVDLTLVISDQEPGRLRVAVSDSPVEEGVRASGREAP